jgi:hypothetical protein
LADKYVTDHESKYIFCYISIVLKVMKEDEDEDDAKDKSRVVLSGDSDVNEVLNGEMLILL